MSNDKTFDQITREDAAEYAAWCMGSLYGDEHPAVDAVKHRCLEDDLFFEFYRGEYADHHSIPRGPSPGFTIADLVCTSSRPSKGDAESRRTSYEAYCVERARAHRMLLDLADLMADALRREISGVRDGDGYWHGSDVVSGCMTDMELALQQHRERFAKFYQLTRRPPPHEGLPF